MDLATTPTLSVPEFQAKWRNTQLSERAAAQSHYIDLCALVGFEPPTTVDQTGADYVFERPVRKLDGSIGYADVWRRGTFAWEYKRRGANLDKAYQQILYYRDDLENPPLLIVTDIERTVVHTNFTNTVRDPISITLDDLSDPEHFRTLRRVFHDPDSLKPGVTVEKVTEEAAARFAALASRLEARTGEPRRVAHFLVQVLFCLFAEDVGLLPKEHFAKLLTYCLKRPEEFVDVAAELFAAMQNGGRAGYEPIARFNGGIFAIIDVVPLARKEIEELLRAAKLDWGSIEPAIFGTLFERSLDPDQRRRLGAHYTSRADIERIVNPVLVAPLRQRWESAKEQADVLHQHWEAAPNRSEATKRQKRFRRFLTDFQQELTRIRILDPACGSGNFLYVALAAIHDLEMEISRYGAHSGLSYMLPMVTPTQLFGLELNPYARELAQVVVWIGHLQWMQAHGFPFKMDPVIDSIETIEIRDALVVDDDGQLREATWPPVDFIIGNPPFLGGKQMRAALGDESVDRLRLVFEDRLPPFADLCCYWFEKARQEISQGTAKRAGLLATNSIRGGANRIVLDRIKTTGDIFMAWDDEPWLLEGAAVRISIVGFDDGSDPQRSLDGKIVENITSSLTTGGDFSKVTRLPEMSGIGFIGDQPSGPFDVPEDLARRWMALPVNPNGRPNSDVLRPFWSAADITGRWSRRWTIDFGAETSESEAALFEAPFDHVVRTVKPIRKRNRNQQARERWWLHWRPRAEMREALARSCRFRFLATPLVSKYRLFRWLPAGVLASNAVMAFAREDDYFFGILQSRAHEVWSLRMGTWLGKGNDPRYTPTTCLETFPLPWRPSQEPENDPQFQAISEAARQLDELRERWLNPERASGEEVKKRTLTNLYNQSPAWLLHAHAALDRAVWAAYGWPDQDPSTVDEETILVRLLALNLERASKRHELKPAAEDIVLAGISTPEAPLASREVISDPMAAGIANLIPEGPDFEGATAGPAL